MLDEVQPEEPLESMILRQRLTYFGHIMRAGGDRMERQMIMGMIEGKRKRGRPPMRWLDALEKDVNMKLEEIRDVTQDRMAWRRLTMTVARSRRRLDGTR